MSRTSADVTAAGHESRSHSIIRTFFRTTAIVEACTWGALIVGMIIKYGLQGTPMVVTVAGWFHGLAWIAFAVACLAAAIRFRWRFWVLLLAVPISVVPFMTIPYDLWLHRSGQLRARSTGAVRQPAAAGQF